MDPYFGVYDSQKAVALKDITFNRETLANRGLQYERLDQLTIDLLLGVR
jgi:xylose isomerase